jgi:O-glycosyl hydrolase
MNIVFWSISYHIMALHIFTDRSLRFQDEVRNQTDKENKVWMGNVWTQEIRSNGDQRQLINEEVHNLYFSINGPILLLGSLN